MAYDLKLADRVRELVDERLGEHVDALTEQKMFGGLAFLVHGHMAVVVSGQGGIMLRVPPDRTEQLLQQPGAAPMVMRGREMTGWLRVAPEAVGTRRQLERWVARGVDHALGLPPKRPARG